MKQTLERWQIIFYSTAAVMLLESILYALMASGEEQPWNSLTKKEETDDNSSTLPSSEVEMVCKDKV